MNKEIKKIIDYFKKYLNIDDRIRFDKLLDYITNLQNLCDKYEEEHYTTFKEWRKGYCRLKELCDKGQLDCKNEEYFNMAQQNMKLVLIIDKAIEYIKGMPDEMEYHGLLYDNKEKKLLLNILQGDKE